MPVAEPGDPAERRTSSGPPSTSTRRRFLGTIGASAAPLAGATRSAAAREPPIVAMRGNYFDPIGLHVEPGTEVRFEIEADSHSATAYEERIPDGATPFDSGTISEGGFEHPFETPGTYDYFCRPHRSVGMVGRVVVDEPGGPAEAAPIPDGDVPDSDAIVERGAVGVDEFDGSGGNGDGRRGPMRGGPMMNGSAPGWMVLVPVGFLTTIFGVVGGTVYWVVTRTDSE